MTDVLKIFPSGPNVSPVRSSENTTPLFIDPWVASSLLQKAIRRGETELAIRAGVTLYRYRGSAIWRRLIIIAYEDVAATSIEIHDETVLAATDPGFRAKFGSELSAVIEVVRKLAAAPKDRSSDYLTGLAVHHPSLSQERAHAISSPLEEQLSLVANQDTRLDIRSLAAWSIQTVDRSREGKRQSACITALFDTYKMIGVPDRVLRAARIAYRQTREVMVLIHPLIWMSMSADGPSKVTRETLQNVDRFQDIPLYAFDKHTRLGKQAIKRFLAENQEVRELLLDYVPPKFAPVAAETAAFYADASPISLRLDWRLSRKLETLGMEADLFRDGIPVSAALPLCEAMTRNLAQLNAVRWTLLKRIFPDA